VAEYSHWIYFNIFVLAMLAVDLFLHRKTHVIRIGEALGWSAFWISLAIAFNAGIYYYMGAEAGLNFFTGYVIEKSLSVDNLFVFLLIFSYFRTPHELQHKVLFWGILGAIVMRAVFIALGITLIHLFEGVFYIFGAFLIYSGFKMAFKSEEEEMEPAHNPVLKLVSKVIPVTAEHIGHRFFVRREKRLWATPLFIVLMSIETTDVIFALDSIPAILAITTDPFIVYTSNIFAILGLRSLFFALAGLMRLFHYLHYALSFILIFIGFKMMIAGWVHIPTSIALCVTFISLLLSILASYLFPHKK
jgi:tellurite resistance protein TerC